MLSRTQRKSAGSAPFSTLIIARPGSSIWIAPPLDVCASVAASAGFGLDSASAETVIGSNVVNLAPAPPNWPVHR